MYLIIVIVGNGVHLFEGFLIFAAAMAVLVEALEDRAFADPENENEEEAHQEDEHVTLVELVLVEVVVQRSTVESREQLIDLVEWWAGQDVLVAKHEVSEHKMKHRSEFEQLQAEVDG